MRDAIIIGELQVWPEDLGEMIWDEATQRVKELGPGWRLPTREEFENILYPDKPKIPNLKEDDYYWSSSEYTANYAWTFLFYNGTAHYFTNKNYPYYVRPVRSFTGDLAMELLLKDF